MLDFLSGRLQKSLTKMQKSTVISEDDLTSIIRDIKFALLEADVNLLVVKAFISDVKKQVIEQGLTGKLNPQQQFIKILHQNLVKILGNNSQQVIFKKPLSKIILVGLQGSGKTTTAAKLSLFAKNKKHSQKPLLVACDIYRPAAIEQLKQLGKQIGIEVFSQDATPQEIAKNAIQYAQDNDFDLIIFDTAGRLAIDEPLMDELVDLKKIIHPDQILFVTDALSGQDVINVAQVFNDRIKLNGAIITKLDSDARGGSALSITHLLKIPINFIGSGEKISSLEIFHPNRIADRILGMGDVLSFIEQAEQNIDHKQAEKLGKRMLSGNFNLDDLLNSLYQIRKMGKFSKIIKMIPGMAGKINDQQISNAESKIKLYEILISSMTLEERKKPKLLKQSSRKNRIIKGSGRSSSEFNRMLNEFEAMSKKIKDFSGKNNTFEGFFEK
ncbi:Signal recognition particle protein [Mesomycoplasma conjunctivae]|uniref:Signal recognition particle protein n=1 Tax=Mesomycoplasma conjunctivae (strain ATCC 25834 / NCTC 10147 / HRC/581) TaxID=572263 RepID=C5J5R9_MESCH|nr:signal recognition particle protein [Mesomycoplasma conjunctivae]CAT04805.1 Signal recognition particle protein [Mesomycoplasma conjunctivae]VEU65833.1 Signal recognition particle protein [Mesomycoplasma conjunctivae]